MKQIILSILISLSAACSMNGQCSMTLSTQGQVDSFRVNWIEDMCIDPLFLDDYIATVRIEGQDIFNLDSMIYLTECTELIISNTSLTDLSGLENLTTAYGFDFFARPGIVISDNLLLQNLEGLQNLRKTSNIEISNNAVLDNTDALNITNLSFYPATLGWTFGNQIKIINNPKLRSFTGLPGLKDASNVIIRDNPMLRDISALSNLKSCYYRNGLESIAGSIYIENNDALTSLSVLDTISVVRDFSIADNDSLQNLSGVTLTARTFTVANNNSLTELGDFNLSLMPDWLTGPSMSIINNDSLASIAISYFEPIYATRVTITDNPMLSMCSEGYICRLNQSSFTEFNISNNAEGCNSESEATACFGFEDFKVDMDMDFVTCDVLRYNIEVSRKTSNADSTELKFYLSNEDVTGLYQILESDGATIVGDTLIWQVTNLNQSSASYAITIEIDRDYINSGNLIAVASLKEDSFNSNSKIELVRGYDVMGTLELNTQAEVDKCHCVGRVNTLSIKDGNNITNLDGLSNVSMITTFEIHNNPLLESLSNLKRLTTLSHLTISNNNVLTEVTDFSKEDDLESLSIIGNNVLKDLSGFRNMRSIDELRIIGNAELENLDGFSALQNLDILVVQDSPELMSLDSLHMLSNVNKQFVIANNDNLITLNGLDKLGRIGPTFNGNSELAIFTIRDNAQLQHLDNLISTSTLRANINISNNDMLSSIIGLDPNWTRVDSITIQSNPLLTSCDAEYICESLEDTDMHVSIVDNAGFCQSKSEVSWRCNDCSFELRTQEEVDSFPKHICLQDFIGKLTISGTDIVNLDSLKYLEVCSELVIENTSIEDLGGLENLVEVYHPGPTMITPGITIIDNHQLKNLNGIGNVYKTSQVAIINNSLLEDIDSFSIRTMYSYCDLDSVKQERKILITDNPSLNNLRSFSQLKNVDDIRIENNDLLSIISFDSLEWTGFFNIENNNSLDSIEGFNDFVECGSLQVINNDNLKSISGFSQMNIADHISIENNELLSGISFDSLGSVRYLRIYNNDNIVTLDRFNNLKNCNSLIIGGNENLTFLSSFTNLDSIDNLSIYGNTRLMSIADFSLVRRINDLYITDNFELERINNFNNLESVYSVKIKNNESLISIDSMPVFNRVDRNLEISNNQKLESLNGFRNLKSIGLVNNTQFEGMEFVGNNSITSFDDFIELDSISGEIRITNNDLLSSILTFSPTVHENFSMRVVDNSNLSSCHSEFICAELLDINFIIGNNASGCFNKAEVSAACTTSTSDLLADDIFDIYPNPVNDLLTIDYKRSNNTRVDISLSKIDGQEIISVQQDIANSQVLDLSDIPSGLYLLSLKTNEGVLVKKIVVE